jgi:hypothetical protein
MNENSSTMRVLKAINLSILSSAFAVIKSTFGKKFPFIDMDAAWKININIGRGNILYPIVSFI